MPQAAPKWRRRSEARPDEILDAALTEFNAFGFDAARVEDIALRAGISKGAIYLYFDSKEALLRGLIEREVAPLAMRLAALAGSGGDDPKAALKLIVTTASELLNDRRKFSVPRLVLSVVGRFPEIGAYYRRRVVEQAISALTEFHRKGVVKGDFRPADSGAAARAIMGPILLHALYRHLLGGKAREGPRERADAHLDILLEGLAAK